MGRDHISLFGYGLHHFYRFLGALGHALFAADAGVFVHSVHLLQFATDGGHRAYFGTDGTADAGFWIDLGFLAAAGQEILDCFRGAYRGAESAIDALIIVDTGKIVLYSDGLYGAFPAADAATDARMGTAANGFGIGSLFFGGAFDIYIAIDRDQHNQLSGTSSYASATGSTLFIIDHAHAVSIHRDGIEHTGSLAIV